MVVDLRTKKLRWSLLCYISLFLRFWNVFFLFSRGGGRNKGV
jgi:hypothetical protein